MEKSFNLITQTEFNRLTYCGIDYDYAVIMACQKGNQPELCQHIVEKMKQDQEILMQETFANFVTMEQLQLENSKEEKKE